MTRGQKVAEAVAKVFAAEWQSRMTATNVNYDKKVLAVEEALAALATVIDEK